MRTLAITQNITVDGSIEMLGDWFDPRARPMWTTQICSTSCTDRTSRADGFLAGRRTFEDLRGYWPKQADDATGITDYLNRVQKYVVSSTMTDPEWQNSTVLSGDPVEEVRALKEQPGQDIVVTGSITLCHALIGPAWSTSTGCSSTPSCRAAAVGCSPTDSRCPELKLLEAKAFRSGITYTRYAGPDPTRVMCARLPWRRVALRSVG